MARSAAQQEAHQKASAESFGTRLARFRRERGLTQVELAERAGLIQVVISNYERGKLRPYADIVARLAEVLEVSADDLLGLPARARTKRISNTGLSRRFVRRLQEINSLPKRDQEALIRTIDHFLGHHRLAHRDD